MWRRRKFVALAAVLVMCLGASLTSAQAAQFETAASDPALFDLDLAQARLDSLHTEADRVRGELARVLDAVDGLTSARDFIELNDQARNERLQNSRTQARNMSINAYIGIGPPLTGTLVLDATSANESNYRSGLLRHQAARMQRAANTFAVLAGEASAEVLSLSDEINSSLRRAEALSRELAYHVDQMPEADWIVSIAAIHREADVIFERTRRAEPTAEQWANLRFCESTETYNIDTGNTFYGAYQFTWETWGTVGGSDNPADAPPAEQDARARLLYADRGSQPWPICGRFLP